MLFSQKFNYFAILVVLFLSACQKDLFSKNRKVIEKKCLEEGYDKGTDLFARCMQVHFYGVEDEEDAQ